MRRLAIVLAGIGLLLTTVTTGRSDAGPGAGPAREAVVTGSVAGYDFALPSAATRVPNSGFFSEGFSSFVDLRAIDLTWRQIQPRPGGISVSRTGSYYGVPTASLGDQLAEPEPFWLRLFASGTPWAPRWLRDACDYPTVGPDYMDMRHVPIWRGCIWNRLRDAWRELMIGRDLRSDPDLRFVYVPGAFTWSEFDYEVVTQGVRQAGLTFAAYRRWHQRMLADLVSIMNGDNDDPGDDYAYKLVYTGEDHPYSDPFGGRSAFFARDAVEAGMGIRTGVT